MSCQEIKVVEGGVNWRKVAGSDGVDVAAYRSALAVGLAPYLGKMYDCVEDIDKDIELVGSILKSAATDTIPHVDGRGRRRFHDRELGDLTVRSKEAWWRWCEAGRPASGVEYEEKTRMRREVRRCAGRAERKRIGRREKLFSGNDTRRYRLPGRKKSHCSRLCVDGVVVSDEDELREAWAAHFRKLSESRVGGVCGLQELESTVNDDMARESLSNEKCILDVPFTFDEVSNVVRKLKRGKAGGYDGILAEHLIWGGDVIITWLLTILNSIIELEAIPKSLKKGVLSPVFKGHGKDPFLVDSYRGITVTSVLAKVLESLVLDRMGLTLQEAGVPHLNQTAYRRHIGCVEALFVTQEAIARYVEEGSPVYLCLYDLQKAYDSVEFPVLLDRLYKAGVNGRTWRLIKDWYQDGVCTVKVNGKVSRVLGDQGCSSRFSVVSYTLSSGDGPTAAEVREFWSGVERQWAICGCVPPC